MPTITITIPRDRSQGTRIAVDGVAGPGCQALTARLQEQLGRTLQDEPTQEFAQQPQRLDQTLDNQGD